MRDRFEPLHKHLQAIQRLTKKVQELEMEKLALSRQVSALEQDVAQKDSQIKGLRAEIRKVERRTSTRKPKRARTTIQEESTDDAI